ncbi:MAG: leucyl/phenylalanyl-tRNA--protein transferase [Desulfobacterales bacterium]|nr:leucyl/phenylalanyl-tRNA--protein transferase [Desulfobacterales bacterium]MBF0395150.1 leucyl/phenylalanyl-tRNA--protein transferase [Desulfobacterales bacterium]
MTVFILSKKLSFPPPQFADHSGLLAVGGDLSPDRLLNAYQKGIFPWFSEGEPILWWSPDPRLVLYPNEFHISKSLKKILNKNLFKITMDMAFKDVICACADLKRKKQRGTWITDEMISAYCRLHDMGFAHSVEAWENNLLVGGLYGVSLGGAFFGESMFTHVSNASKVAFVILVEFLKKYSFDIIDCQIKTKHLTSFGAREIPRKIFLSELEISLNKTTRLGTWKDFL